MNTETPQIIKGGCKVRLQYPNNEVKVFEISHDSHLVAPEKGIITLFSPLGRVLLGKCCGDEVEFSIGSLHHRIKIVEIL